MDAGVHLPLIDFSGGGFSYRRLAETVDAARACGFGAVSETARPGAAPDLGSITSNPTIPGCAPSRPDNAAIHERRPAWRSPSKPRQRKQRKE